MDISLAIKEGKLEELGLREYNALMQWFKENGTDDLDIDLFANDAQAFYDFCLDDTAYNELEMLYGELLNSFKAKTGLTLSLQYDGEKMGAVWKVEDALSPSAAALSNRDLFEHVFPDEDSGTGRVVELFDDEGTILVAKTEMSAEEIRNAVEAANEDSAFDSCDYGEKISAYAQKNGKLFEIVDVDERIEI